MSHPLSELRDHPFEGESLYCEHWDSTEYGDRLSFGVRCGWSEEQHPNARPLHVEAKNATDEAWRHTDMARERPGYGIDHTFWYIKRSKWMAEYMATYLTENSK